MALAASQRRAAEAAAVEGVAAALQRAAGAAAVQVRAQELSCGSRQERSPSSTQQPLITFESESSSHS
jgi:hypothetical protein